ncbi:MAG: alpha-E domain-containing protein [Fibrobacteraceae bacterium]|nr:alpha-E domain-containing protein [Fibrobacteraceae bacterium]
MLSRVAERVYWIGRYVERAENTARCIDVNLQLQLDLPSGESSWEALLQAMGSSESFLKKYGRATKENVLNYLSLDPENPNSIFSCISQARENARCVRETCSSEMWTVLNRYYLLFKDAAVSKTIIEKTHDFFVSVKELSQLFTGVALGTMSHGEAWQFLKLGRMVERADQTSRILDVKYFLLLPSPALVGMALDSVQWTALLKSVSAFEMFRKRYSLVTPKNVSEFLIFDEEFPRSIRVAVAGEEASLRRIVKGTSNGSDCESIRAVGKLRADLEFSTIDEYIQNGLHETLDKIQRKMSVIHGAITQEFFS